MSRLLIVAPLLLVAAAPPLPTGPTIASLEAMRAMDLRLARIGSRLAIGNAALCDRLIPMTGLVLHTIGQYPPAERPVVKQVFGFQAPLAVEAVVPDGAAARAGVEADDAILAEGGSPLVAEPGPSASSVESDRALAVLAGLPLDRPVELTLMHDGIRKRVALAAVPGCRTFFQLLLKDSAAARADGEVVQIGRDFLDQTPDDDVVAAVVAHELAHNVLGHRVRLDRAGIRRGVWAEFGRNKRLIRRTENEADELSVTLLYNAGYDPRAAIRFWRDHGDGVDSGLFRSHTHASAKARAAAIEAAIADIPVDASRPYIPALLATRNRPLDQ